MRERLIELICNFKKVCNLTCSGLDKSCTRCMKEQLADYLLDNGVIVLTEKMAEMNFDSGFISEQEYRKRFFIDENALKERERE